MAARLAKAGIGAARVFTSTSNITNLGRNSLAMSLRQVNERPQGSRFKRTFGVHHELPVEHDISKVKQALSSYHSKSLKDVTINFNQVKRLPITMGLKSFTELHKAAEDDYCHNLGKEHYKRSIYEEVERSRQLLLKRCGFRTPEELEMLALERKKKATKSKATLLEKNTFKSMTNNKGYYRKKYDIADEITPMMRYRMFRCYMQMGPIIPQKFQVEVAESLNKMVMHVFFGVGKVPQAEFNQAIKTFYPNTDKVFKLTCLTAARSMGKTTIAAKFFLSVLLTAHEAVMLTFGIFRRTTELMRTEILKIARKMKLSHMFYSKSDQLDCITIFFDSVNNILHLGHAQFDISIPLIYSYHYYTYITI